MTGEGQKQITHKRLISELPQLRIARHSEKLSKAGLGEGRIVKTRRGAQALPKRQIRSAFWKIRVHAASFGLGKASVTRGCASRNGGAGRERTGRSAGLF